jgi:hypothetical protein
MSTIQVPNILTIDQLLDHYFTTDSPEELRKFVKLAEDGLLDMGKIWQKILAEYLEETDLAWRDYTDFSDAKFATICSYETHNYREIATATISVTNKIGMLRVCLWNKWKHNMHTHHPEQARFRTKQNVFFMLIPYDWYKGRKNVKVNCDSYSNDPCSTWYDNFGCSFADVIKPVDSTQARKLYESQLKSRPAAETHMA